MEVRDSLEDNRRLFSLSPEWLSASPARLLSVLMLRERLGKKTSWSSSGSWSWSWSCSWSWSWFRWSTSGCVPASRLTERLLLLRCEDGVFFLASLSPPSELSWLSVLRLWDQRCWLLLLLLLLLVVVAAGAAWGDLPATRRGARSGLASSTELSRSVVSRRLPAMVIARRPRTPQLFLSPSSSSPSPSPSPSSCSSSRLVLVPAARGLDGAAFPREP